MRFVAQSQSSGNTREYFPCKNQKYCLQVMKSRHSQPGNSSYRLTLASLTSRYSSDCCALSLKTRKGASTACPMWRAREYAAPKNAGRVEVISRTGQQPFSSRHDTKRNDCYNPSVHATIISETTAAQNPTLRCLRPTY